MAERESRSLVSTNAAWFAGVHPETAASLADTERQLGVCLPAALRWLLSEYGYSTVCGVANLSESAEVTIRCREVIGLPVRFVVLDDRGDAGVVLLDTASPGGRVIWVGAHDVRRLAAPEAIDEFTDCIAWVERCLDDGKADS